MNRLVRIVSTGTYIPEMKVSSIEIDRKLNKNNGWTERMFGINSRYYAQQHETTSLMATRAAERALAEAGMDAVDLDCIVSACGVMEQAIPSTAVLVQNKLGLGASGIAAFDVNSTCLSFVTAFDLIADAITLGRYKNVLIVSSEIASCGLDWANPEAAAIFGDGAAAVIVTRSTKADGSHLAAGHMETYGASQEACRLEGGGTRMLQEPEGDDPLGYAIFKMDGREALKTSLAYMPQFLETLLSRARIGVQDLQLIVPHQASDFSLKAMQKKLNLEPEKVFKVFSDYGNQIAASIPHALHHAIAASKLKRGDRFMMVGTSAGISIGGLVLEY